LLTFSDSVALNECTAAWAGRVTTVSATNTTAPWTLPDATTIPAPTALFIRPDGYVAWISDGTPDLADLHETITAWCGAADHRIDKERVIQ
jgi:3-(3-hydroxy-phenyl)propionate hydroxylase